ncbi:LPS export ABC transporter periplasmic protein LptC [Diaphorobacter sp. HDW4A]|uniref:LPS export ABC transporter periplasmic protein LptC n=1 Tax=Diaphorobacter sp. HDW4A TaxID=2714924 RepID=UPI00140C4835|nr:LPS export ABC transporter periplasmic protein LptC [Diaphorobacter sp. HDW4A]QIL82398.1 LPS export ABC transporter periplasmic protein LptC [Diaphorobacter sp. HDW4A]
MTLNERLRRVWEIFSIYLPILLMGLLALGTWWLVRNAPKPIEQPQQREISHEPDYYMRDFSIKTFDATGRLQSEIQGETLKHFMDTDTLEIQKARMRSISPDGRVTLATANRALSNADGTEVQLFGDAVVTREEFRKTGTKSVPPMQFRGEFLHVWPNQERVKSHLPVTLTRGPDQFTGDAMDFDNYSQVLNMRGDVKGKMQPSRVTSTLTPRSNNRP